MLEVRQNCRPAMTIFDLGLDQAAKTTHYTGYWFEIVKKPITIKYSWNFPRRKIRMDRDGLHQLKNGTYIQNSVGTIYGVKNLIRPWCKKLETENGLSFKADLIERTQYAQGERESTTKYDTNGTMIIGARGDCDERRKRKDSLKPRGGKSRNATGRHNAHWVNSEISMRGILGRRNGCKIQLWGPV